MEKKIWICEAIANILLQMTTATEIVIANAVLDQMHNDRLAAVYTVSVSSHFSGQSVTAASTKQETAVPVDSFWILASHFGNSE